MEIQGILAGRTEFMGASALREILKVASRPGVVSLAGGLPPPESIPVDLMRELMSRVIDRHGTSAFQYDATEGFMPLRRALADYIGTRGIFCDAEEVLAASGSQGVLDGLGKIMISRGDVVAVERPTYLGAIQAFRPYEPKFVCLDTDEYGLIPESLERILERHHPKFAYLVPTFQNPTGRTILHERRMEIADIIVRRSALLVEDDPYSLLRFKGVDIPPIKALAPDHVVYISTLSKIFAPGLRIGFCVAPELIRKWLVLVKQGVDLHTSGLGQALAAEYLKGDHLSAHLPGIIRRYESRKEAMVLALSKYFPDGWSWTDPDGGMFLWVTGPEGVNMDEVYLKAVEVGVAFVPGRHFFTDDGEGMETMRLNFTSADETTIDRAMKTLGAILKETTKAMSSGRRYAAAERRLPAGAV